MGPVSGSKLEEVQLERNLHSFQAMSCDTGQDLSAPENAESLGHFGFQGHQLMQVVIEELLDKSVCRSLSFRSRE